IDGQEQRQLALLDEALDEGVAHARGDVPVDSADVVAGLVLAHLLEGDAAALEDAAVLAAEQVLDGAARPQLQTADLANHFAWQHNSTSTARGGGFLSQVTSRRAEKVGRGGRISSDRATASQRRARGQGWKGTSYSCPSGTSLTPRKRSLSPGHWPCSCR